jgi:predicted transcriptional regulator
MMDPDAEKSIPHLAAEIVSSYVRHHQVLPGELSNLIISVHRSLSDVGKPPLPDEKRMPAVTVRQSVRPEHVVCLECGFRGVSIRRHLMLKHGVTPGEYRGRWGLPKDHPIVAPSYSKQRSALAHRLGLGRKRREPEIAARSVAPPRAPKRTELDSAFAASLAAPKRRRGPRAGTSA